MASFGASRRKSRRGLVWTTSRARRRFHFLPRRQHSNREDRIPTIPRSTESRCSSRRSYLRTRTAPSSNALLQEPDLVREPYLALLFETGHVLWLSSASNYGSQVDSAFSGDWFRQAGEWALASDRIVKCRDPICKIFCHVHGSGASRDTGAVWCTGCERSGLWCAGSSGRFEFD